MPSSAQNTLARRVAVMDAGGDRLILFVPRDRAAELVAVGLATRHQAREIRLTCHPLRARGQRTVKMFKVSAKFQ